MAETSKPTAYPRFASTGNAYDHENDVIAEPSEAKKDKGWFARIPPLPYEDDQTQDMPPFRWMNWLHRWAYKWVLYLESKLDIAMGNTSDTVLTISSGSITPTTENHSVANESSALEDELTNIYTTNLKDGRLLLLRLNSSDQTVKIIDGAGGAGQIFLQDSWDLVLTNTDQGMLFQRIGSDWYEIAKWGFFEDTFERGAFVPLHWFGMQLPHRKYIADTVTVGDQPVKAVFDGRHIWVGNINTSTVSKVDPTTNAVVDTITVGSGPHSLVCDGSNIWVSNINDNTVSRIDIATSTVIATITGFNSPRGMAFGEGYLWVCNHGTNEIKKVDPSTDTIVNTITVGTGPNDCVSDGLDIHVACQTSNDVHRITMSTDMFNGSYSVGNSPWGIAFDGGNMWITNEADGTVSKYQLVPGGGSVISTVTVGNGPKGVNFDGTYILVANSTDDTVSKIDIHEDAVKLTLSVGNNPQAFTYDGIHSWVTERDDDTIRKILSRVVQ